MIEASSIYDAIGALQARLPADALVMLLSEVDGSRVLPVAGRTGLGPEGRQAIAAQVEFRLPAVLRDRTAVIPVDGMFDGLSDDIDASPVFVDGVLTAVCVPDAQPEAIVIIHTSEQSPEIAAAVRQAGSGLRLSLQREADRRQRREAELVIDLVDALRGSAQMPVVMSAVARTLARAAGMARAAVMFPGESGYLVPAAAETAEGEPDSQLWGMLQSLSPTPPAFTDVIVSGVSRVFARPESEVGLTPGAWIDPLRIRSLVVMPLRAGREVSGVVLLDDPDPDALSATRIRTAERVAEHAATVVALARTIGEERTARRRSQLVLNTVARAATQLNSTGVLTVISEGVNEITGDDTTVAFQLDGGVPRRISVSGSGEGVMTVIASLSEGVGMRVPVLGRNRDLTPLDAETAPPGLFERIGIGRLLVAPVRRANRDLGWVVSFDETQVPYRSSDLRVVAAMTNQAALSLHTAVLLESERASVARLEDIDKLKNAFVAAVSHELRTPLTAIVGFSAILGEQVDDPALKGFIDDIRRESSVLESMIGNLLDTSRLEAGMLTLNQSPSDVAAIATEAADVVRHGHASRLIRIQATPPPPIMLLDPVRMRQVFVNLLENAAKYSPDSMPIDLTIDIDAGSGGDPDRLVVAVEDRGDGVPVEHREAIFQRFNRLGSDEAKPGTGIGLYLVKALVSAHGGDVRVVDRADGPGARFEITLPITAGVLGDG